MLKWRDCWRDSGANPQNYAKITDKMYQPRYQITNEILNKISEIEAIRARVSISRILPTREAEMRYRATVEATHSSTSIEGNPFSVVQVDAILSNKPLLTRHEYAEIEVKNYKKALDYIFSYELSDISVDSILEIHRLLTDGLLDSSRSGKWRKNPVYIENQEGKTVYSAASSKEVPERIKDLIFWLNSNALSIHPVIVAAILHHELVSIHPFADGNGRTARATTSLFLKTAKYDFRGSLVLDSFYATDKNAYYWALQNSQGPTFESSRGRDLTSWLEYFVDGFLASARVLEAEVKLLSSAIKAKDTRLKLSRDEIDLISYVTQFGEISVVDAEDILPSTSRRTLQRTLKSLVDKRIFTVKGNAKSTRYALKK